MKFKDPKLKNEIFVRIDMKHSYFRTICLLSIFSGVKIVVSKKFIHVYD